MSRKMRYLIVVCLMCLSTEAWAQAQKQKSPPAKEADRTTEVSADPQATSATYGDWLLSCRRLGDTQQRICDVSQRIQVQGQPGPIARLSFAVDSAAKKLRLTVVLPNNAMIPAQPTVANGDAGQDEVKLAWHRCMPGGCFADALLPDDVVKAWRNSTEQGRITFRDGLGRDIGVPISFRGLSPALDALVKQN
jgi:invasion protein IalB